MEKVYVYYESKYITKEESTTGYIEVFRTFKAAHNHLKQRRKEYIDDNGFVPHEIDGQSDKPWCRLCINTGFKNYIDLIIEEKKIIN